jgi:hypothetical protein
MSFMELYDKVDVNVNMESVDETPEQWYNLGR